MKTNLLSVSYFVLFILFMGVLVGLVLDTKILQLPVNCVYYNLVNKLKLWKNYFLIILSFHVFYLFSLSIHMEMEIKSGKC